MGDWIGVGPAARRAYLAAPQAGAGGAGILVLHAWWGLTAVFTEVCDRLAQEGFVALAPDLYANEVTTDSIDEAEKLVALHDQESDIAKRVVLEAAQTLQSLPTVTTERIGVIGFSLGAYWALHVSQVRPDDIAAVVAMYGTSDGDFSTAKAAYLGHFAENDDFEPLEGVRALESSIRHAGLDVSCHIYPHTGHWFVEPDRPDAYNAEAAELAWKRTIDFLRDKVR